MVGLFLLLLAVTANAQVQPAETPIRIGLTPVFLDERINFISKWQSYLSRRLKRPVEFIQRKSYKAITELLLDGSLDTAWICGYPYVRNSDNLKLLVAPVYQGRPLYQSYLIVPSDDSRTGSLLDLKGRVFAFSDPDSNSGFLVPQAQLIREGIEPRYFFEKAFYAWTHRDVVAAVAAGLAQGGSVDGYVWDTLSITHPELTGKTRVISRSQRFGFPPFAVNRAIDPERYRLLQNVLSGMQDDPEGKELLSQLNLDGFIEVKDSLYDGIRESAELFHQYQRLRNP